MSATRECTPLELSWLAEGFELVPMHGPFVHGIVRQFARPETHHLRFRALVLAEHCNGYATAHGGFLATLADIWLAYNIYHRLPQGARMVTANLTVDYLTPVGAGDWLESQIDRVRLGSRLCHASGAILTTGRPVVAMRGTFAMIEAKAGQAVISSSAATDR